MIDLHSHILHGLDDGPASIRESVMMARAALAAGTRTIVATPHVDTRYGLGPDDIDAAVAGLREQLAAEDVGLEVLAGAEVAAERLVAATPAELERLALGDGPYLLVECPLTADFGAFDALVLDLCAEGQPILLAHPERSPGFQREPARVVRLVEAGALCSLTAGALSGRFGRLVKGLAAGMLGAGLAHNVASDAHDAVRRPPDLRDAIPRVTSSAPEGTFTWLTVDVPGAILRGDPVPAAPATRRS